MARRRRTGSHQSTVKTARERQRAKTTSNLTAFLLFLVAAGIGAAIVIAILRGSEGDTYIYFVYSASSEAGDLSAEWMMDAKRSKTADQDLEQIKRALGTSIEKSNTQKLHFQSRNITSDAEMSQLLTEASDKLGKDDHLIIYFAMDGVAKVQDGETIPFLRNPTQSRSDVKISMLLEKVSQFECQSKLLLFETGSEDLHITDTFRDEIDPNFVPLEIGFDHLFIDALKNSIENEEAQTWAICSHRQFERSSYLRSLDGSIFGTGVAEAITSWLEEGGQLSVEKFYGDVLRSCQKYSRSDDGFAQQPLLINCATQQLCDPMAFDDTDNNAEGTKVAWIYPAKKDDDTEDSTDTPGLEPKTDPFKTVWTTVNKIESRSKHPHSPVDFAPELWAKLIDKLVDQNVQFCCDTLTNKKNVNTTEFANDLRNLETVLSGEELPEENGEFVTDEVREIHDRLQQYVNTWSENLIPTNDQAIQAEKLREHTRSLGYARDNLFHLRYHLLLFNESPDEQGKNALLELFTLWNDYSNTTKLSQLKVKHDERLFGNFVQPEVKEVKPGDLKDAPSKLVFETMLTKFIVSNYLRGVIASPEFPRRMEDAPRELAKLASSNKEEYSSRIVPKVSFLEQLRSDSDPLFNRESDVVLNGVPEFNSFRLRIADGKQVFRLKQVGEDKSLVESSRRLQFALTPAIGSQVPSYKPPQIIWPQVVRKIGDIFPTDIQGAKITEQPANDSGTEVWQVELLGLNHSAQIEIQAMLEKVSPTWQLSNVPSGSGVTASLEPRPDSSNTNAVCTLSITPNKVRTKSSKPIELFINVEPRNASQRVDPKQVKLVIVLPERDRYQIKLKNRRIKADARYPASSESEMNFGDLTLENAVTIRPLTTLPTEFQLQVSSSNLVARKIRLDIFSYQNEPGESGKLPSVGQFEDFDDLVSARTLVPLTHSISKVEENAEGFIDLPAAAQAGWQNVVLAKQEPSSVPGALLFVVTEESSNQKWFQWVELERIRSGKLVRKNDETWSLSANTVEFNLNTSDLKFKRSSIGLGRSKLPFELNEESRTLIASPKSYDQQNRRVMLDVLNEPRALHYMRSGDTFTIADPIFRVGFDLHGKDDLKDKMRVLRLPGGQWYFFFKEEVDRDNHNLILQLDDLAEGDKWSIGMSGHGIKGHSDRTVDFLFSCDSGSLVFYAEAKDHSWKINEGTGKQEFMFMRNDNPVATLHVIQNANIASLVGRPTFSNFPQSPISFARSKTLRARVAADAKGFNELCKIKLTLDGEPLEGWPKPFENSRSLPIVMPKLEAGPHVLVASVIDEFQREGQPESIEFTVSPPPDPAVVDGGDPPEPLVTKGSALLIIKPSTKRLVSAKIGSINLNIKGKDNPLKIDGVDCTVSGGYSSQMEANWIQFKKIPVGNYDVVIVAGDGKDEKTKTVPMEIVAGEPARINVDMEEEEKETPDN